MVLSRILFLLSVSSPVYCDVSHYYGIDYYKTYHKFNITKAYKQIHEGCAATFHKKVHTYSQDAHAVSAYLGWRINEYFGFEYGFTTLKSFDDSEKAKIGYLRTKAIHGQAIFYVPCYGFFHLFAAGGMSGIYLTYDNYGKFVFYDNQRLAPKVSTGFEFSVYNRIKARASFVWHDMSGFQNKHFNIENHYHAGFGLNYCFD